MCVTKSDLIRAIEIIEEAEAQMLQVFSYFGKNDLADMTEKIMKLVGAAGEISWGDLYRKLFKNISRSDLTQILSNLKTVGFLELGDDGIIKHIRENS
jgi:hypothetical protein